MLARRLTESCLHNVVSVLREFVMQRIVATHKAERWDVIELGSYWSVLVLACC